MTGRPRTTPVRLSAPDARVILQGLAELRPDIGLPDALDLLAARLVEALPEHERRNTLAWFKQPRQEAPAI